MLFGIFFIFTAVYGFTKFKDVFRKMHVAGVAELIGVPFILIGCGLMYISIGKYIMFFKLLFLCIIIYIVSPMNTNALSEIAYKFYLKNKK